PQTTDGLSLTDGVSELAPSPDQLPGADALTRKTRDLATRVTRLRSTPRTTSYNGPVLFEGRAAAQLFASVIGPELTAERRRMSDNPAFENMAGDEGFLDQLGS